MSTPIKRENIRKGDRYTVTFEYTASGSLHGSANPTSTALYELIERPVVLPTAPGIYLDKDGDVWDRAEGFDRHPLPAEHAPFTLLRPVAEVAAEVLAEVRQVFPTDDPMYWGHLDSVAAEFGVTK